jgi:hypothetical protein
MSLYIDQLVTLQGITCRGFFVRNRNHKVLAMGAIPSPTDSGWVSPKAKRYARDVTLCAAISRLTGVPIKWNLHYDPKKRRYVS